MKVTKTANSDPIYRKQVVNMLVIRILKHGKSIKSNIHLIT